MIKQHPSNCNHKRSANATAANATAANATAANATTANATTANANSQHGSFQMSEFSVKKAQMEFIKAHHNRIRHKMARNGGINSKPNHTLLKMQSSSAKATTPSQMQSFLANNSTQVGGCTGPCDTKLPRCKKIKKHVNACKVDTHKLLVRKDATICGNLTVNGLINNLELQLLRDTAVPPTDEVYNQFVQFPNVQNILENIQEFSVPRDLVVPGTEINADAPVYGYNAETQELILGGGPELSYNPNFEAVNMRYHGQNPAELVLTTPENMQAWYEHTLSYYLQRGFEMPGIDVYPQYEGQFIFNNGSNDFVGIKFYFEDGPIPIALDLVATATPSIVANELFEPDPSLRKNGFYYPIRIPITTNFAEFNQKFNKEPIVYYDNLHRRITIRVPECNNTPTELFNFKLSVPCCNCNLDLDLQDKLVAFDGTFSLMRRNSLNQLVSSSFNQLEYLIQASSVVSVKSLSVDHGQQSIYTKAYNFNEPGGTFTGLAIPLMNGEGPQTDVYTINIGDFNANSQPSNPLIFPELEDGPNSFQAGDNPVTTLVENYGDPIFNVFYDTDIWNFALLGLPLPVMSGETTPEENPAVPLPEFFVDPTKILNTVVAHEFSHDTQFMQGMIFFLPTEGQAVGIEQDPKLNDSVFSGFRGSTWAGNYLPNVIRGVWPLTMSDIASNAILGIPTYGSSIFWRYIATQFDYNYQVVRRLGDIMSNQTLGPLLEENGIPFNIAALGFSGEIGLNPAGSLLALRQALTELHGKNVQDVFSNYAISLAMLRNNTSIPVQYRHEYPYWLASPSYPGYQELALLEPSFAAWWQNYQDNVIPGKAQLATSPALPGSPFVAIPQASADPSQLPITALGVVASPDINACTPNVGDMTGKIGINIRSAECSSAVYPNNMANAGAIATITGFSPASVFSAPGALRYGVTIELADAEALIDAVTTNPNITLTIEQSEEPFIPLLDQDVIDIETQDMTMLLFQVPKGVNTVTVDVAEGEWRLSVLQFTSDGTPVGQFIIDGPHANSGGQTVFDMSQFIGTGYVRLVCANVGIHDYGGLNNWCGLAPIMTGKISILRS